MTQGPGLQLGPAIKSPCVLICQLDLTSGLCAGCGRSKEEIRYWTRYTDAEREAIMEGLEARLDAAGLR